MNLQFDQRWKAEGGREKVRMGSALRLPPSALTLIELLVVIVILTTLVGGVIPILSPNNDTRKINAASRGLQSYITLAQARAARRGRPQGIAFRESSAGSGVALEVFGLEVPPPFAGFSTESRVRVDVVDDDLVPNTAPITYGPITPQNMRGNQRTRFSPQYFGYELYRLRFELAAAPTVLPMYTADQLPPRTFRIGDVIDVDGNQFLIVDDDRVLVETFAPSTVEYVNPTSNVGMVFVDSLIGVWLNNGGQLPPQGLKRYTIQRQPTNSSESSYQLPAGIVIDMQASVAEGSENAPIVGRFPIDESFFVNPPDRPLPSAGAPIPPDIVGIMFSPTGAVSSLLLNGNELNNASRIVLMLGRIENGGIDPSTINFSDTTTLPWAVQTGEEIEDVQERINWLNLDSRLLSIVTSNGRVVVSETAFVNLDSGADEDGDGDTIAIDADEQLEAAHGFAHEMSTAN